jgi:hypothetical protein
MGLVKPSACVAGILHRFSLPPTLWSFTYRDSDLPESDLFSIHSTSYV